MFAWGRFKEDGQTDGRSSQSGVRPGSGNPVEQEDSRPRAPLHRCRSMMSRARKRARRTGWLGSSNLLPSASVRNRARSPPYAPFVRNYITQGKGWWPVKVASCEWRVNLPHALVVEVPGPEVVRGQQVHVALVAV